MRTFCRNFARIRQRLLGIQNPDASRRIPTHPGRIRTYPEVSGRIRDAPGIGTSSAEVCMRPVGPPSGSSCARPAAASSFDRSRQNQKSLGLITDALEKVAESGRDSGRAQLRALTFLEARYGAFSAKMQTAGTLPVPSRYPPGTLPVPCTYPVHFAGA